MEIVTVRVQAIGRIGQSAGSAATATASSPDGVRSVHTGSGREEIPVRHRSRVGAEAIAGPLLIEEDYSTLFIARGWLVRAIGGGHLLGTRTKGRPA